MTPTRAPSAQRLVHGASSAHPPFQNANATSAGAVDTSVPWDLVFYGQLANSSETITLESWRVELYSHA